MVFYHFLAYGNSDQASFRNASVQSTFDVITVPGTIASYYHEATAAFVLSSQIQYLIDPRTPLFQGDMDEPRASHVTLAEWHGPTVSAAVSKGNASFSPAFYSPDVIREMVTEIIDRQRAYSGLAPVVKKKLDRYAALLAEAMQQQGKATPTTNAMPPYAVLAPYFAVSGTSDPWWKVMLDVWDSVAALPNPGEVIPVVCLDGRRNRDADGVAALADVLPLLPRSLSSVAFFWITDFDERKVDESQLRALWNVIAGRPNGRQLINLYGGFFSICMQHAGLQGFGNGLTYSESRSWPALASTGAAPPRYYVRDLHLFVPPAVAAVLESVDVSFACSCEACDGWRATGQSIASLPYHDLKRHFALARKWELDLASSTPLQSIADQLETARNRAIAAKPGNVVLQSFPSLEYLDRWASVLRSP